MRVAVYGVLTLVTRPDEVVADLQVLTALRADLMGDWVRGVNRLRALPASIFPASIFPALERAFDYSSQSPLILLTGDQTPAGLREVGAPAVAEFLRASGAWAKGIPAVAESALAAARMAAELLDLDRRGPTLGAQLLADAGGDLRSRIYYQRKRHEGKIHTEALIALARRLVDVVWAILRDDRVFQPSAPLNALTAA